MYIYNAMNYGMPRMLEIKRMSSKFVVSTMSMVLHFALK